MRLESFYWCAKHCQCYSWDMGQETKKKIFIVYLAYSMLIILAWAFLAHGPGWHRSILIESEHKIPLRPTEYVSSVLTFLLVPAIYGLFSLQVLRRLNKGESSSGIGFFVGAVIIGVIVAFGAFVSFTIGGRFDCGNYCDADVPSQTAGNIMAALSLVFLVIPPILILSKLRAVNRSSNSK